MSAEEAYTNNREWEQERGELEIKMTLKNDCEACPCGVRACQSSDCKEDAVGIYVIGEVSKEGGCAEVYVCNNHDYDDVVWSIYEARN